MVSELAEDILDAIQVEILELESNKKLFFLIFPLDIKKLGFMQLIFILL